MVRGALGLSLFLTLACEVPQECVSGELCTVAGTGDFGFNGDDLPGLETMFYLPSSVREGRDGDLLILDFNNHRVRELAEDGTIRTVVGVGLHAYAEPGVLARETPLENPIDAIVGPDGLLYVLPLHEGRVLRISAEDRVEVVAGTGELGDDGDGGPATDARLWYPAGIAFASDGTMYVCDQVSGTVRRIDPGGIITTVVGRDAPPETVALPLEGPGNEMRLALPRGLWMDEARDRLLIADARNHRVGALDLTSGHFATLVGDGTPEVLNWPDAVAVTPGGTVVISEQRGRRLSALRDGELQVVAGTGATGDPEATSLPPLQTPLVGPAGLHITADGDVWIADMEGSRVFVWTDGVEALDSL